MRRGKLAQRKRNAERTCKNKYVTKTEIQFKTLVDVWKLVQCMHMDVSPENNSIVDIHLFFIRLGLGQAKDKGGYKTSPFDALAPTVLRHSLWEDSRITNLVSEVAIETVKLE